MDEPALKLQLASLLGADFRMLPEVDGVSIVDGKPLRADFLIYPNAGLIARGFVAEWMGVEVKAVNFAKCESKKLYGTFWQAVCYSQTNFIVDGKALRPAGCALYLGDVSHHSRDPLAAIQLRRWEILLELGVYANTGIVRGTSTADWALWFGQGRYFSKAGGLTKIPRGLKRYTGNIYKRAKTKKT